MSKHERYGNKMQEFTLTEEDRQAAKRDKTTPSLSCPIFQCLKRNGFAVTSIGFTTVAIQGVANTARLDRRGNDITIVDAKKWDDIHLPTVFGVYGLPK
jgi:hypothetical protein